MNGAPETGNLTVILVSLVGGDALEATLRALRAEQVPCIAVLAEDKNSVDAWSERHRWVHFIAAPGTSVPERRRRGVEATNSEFVALLEDTTCPDAGWSDAVRQTLAKPGIYAAGGPVRISPDLAPRSRALAWSEYGFFHPDRIAGPTDPDGISDESRLPGNNMAYRRAALCETLGPGSRGLVEADVAQALSRAGLRLVFDRRMSVTYAFADVYGSRLATRFAHGRIYGGMRVVGKSIPARLGWILASLALPILLPTRSLARLIATAGAAEAVKTGAWLSLMEIAWALGESVGYVAGADRGMAGWR